MICSQCVKLPAWSSTWSTSASVCQWLSPVLTFIILLSLWWSQPVTFTLQAFLLLCWHTTCVLPQNESSASFGSFKHQASDSLRLWSVWDWTRLCCWAQGGLARSDDLTHKLHSAGPRWCAALCVLHEVIRVGSCRAVCSILSCFTVRKCSDRTLSSVNSTL